MLQTLLNKKVCMCKYRRASSSAQCTIETDHFCKNRPSFGRKSMIFATMVEAVKFKNLDLQQCSTMVDGIGHNAVLFKIQISFSFVSKFASRYCWLFSPFSVDFLPLCKITSFSGNLKNFHTSTVQV